MFKKIYEKIDTLKESIDYLKTELHEENLEIKNRKKEFSDKLRWVNEHSNKEDHNLRIIESQQRTIDQLTKALCDKYEHGLFIFSEDCKIPMVIRNGKELTNDLTTSFSIDWENGDVPNIQIEQYAGTNRDNDY